MTDKLTVSSDSGEVSDRSYRTADDLGSLCVRRHMYTPAKQQGHGSMIHPPILSYPILLCHGRSSLLRIIFENLYTDTIESTVL
jgi:hypothetical protein